MKLYELFPGRVAVTPKEAADAIGCSYDAILAAIANPTEPLVARRLGGASRIPIDALDEYLRCRRADSRPGHGSTTKPGHGTFVTPDGKAPSLGAAMKKVSELRLRRSRATAKN